MRDLIISLTGIGEMYPNGRNAGVIGEHNATQLEIELSESMKNNAEYYIVSFETGFGAVLSNIITQDARRPDYVQGGVLFIKLWQELTLQPKLDLTVSAYCLMGDEPVLIEKSPLISVTFDMAVDDCGRQADTGAYGLIGEVLEIARSATHTHTNKALLDTYTHTESDIADAVTKKHTHSNKALLDTYTNTESDISDAVTKKHTHTNKALLDTYTHTESDIADAVTKKHTHSNKTLLDTYTNTDSNISDAVANKHTHPNAAQLGKIGENDGALTYDGAPVGNISSVATFADLPASAQANERCRVRSGGEQLTFGSYPSLVFNAAPDTVPLKLCGAKSIGIYSETDPSQDSNCVAVSTGVDDNGNVYFYMYVYTDAANDEHYTYFSRNVTLLGVAMSKGWHDSSNQSCAAPTMTNLTVSRIVYGSEQYVSTDTLPGKVVEALKALSLIVNTSAAEMHSDGEYVYDGTAWVLQYGEDGLELYAGTLAPNRKYYATFTEDVTLTLPAASSLDLTRDNSILMYINNTTDIDVTFTDVLHYGSSLPDTTAGYHDLIFTFNAIAGKWQVGALGTGAVA